MFVLHRARPILAAVLLAALSVSTLAAEAAPVALTAASVPAAQTQLPAPDWDAPHVPGQLLVGYAAGTAAAPTALSASGVTIVQDIPELGMALVSASPAGATAFATAQADDAAALATAAAELTSDPAIAWAEPNYIFQLDFVPNDPLYATQQAAALTRINAPQAWDLTQGRPEVVIAILDTGVDLTHPDLAGGIWQNPKEAAGAPGVDDDGNGFVDDVNGWDFASNDNKPDDDYGHGTHVAGIAAARINNGVGVAGMAGEATIMPVDVFAGGIGTYESLIRAIIYATDNGARVINMSLGASSYSRGEEMAVNYAWSHGVVVVAAAGNTCNGGNDSVPPCLSDHYPAAHQNVIAVAATTTDDYVAYFSTRGAFVDVAAPGVSIYSTYKGNGYTSLSGTSMATPHVSGLAALILSRNPKLTPDQVRVLIESTSIDLGPKGPDVYFGYGRIDASRALAATTADPGPYPTPTPWPPLNIDLPGCTELVPDGGFEDGAGAWTMNGSVLVDSTQTYSGTQQALHFLGGPNVGGVVTRTLDLPAWPRAGVLRFAYRIENQDAGWGTNPAAPYDDRLTVEFRDASGKVVASLLRTGNSADTAYDGLPWDRYLYRIGEADLNALRAANGPRLVITAQNDSDSAKTEIWVDSVQMCVQSWAQRVWYPWIRVNG